MKARVGGGKKNISSFEGLFLLVVSGYFRLAKKKAEENGDDDDDDDDGEKKNCCSNCIYVFFVLSFHFAYLI